MKDEEFNDLLQFHAESFELKPSSGSFDSVIRKLNRQKRHKLVVRVLPMAAAIAALPVAWFVFRGTPQAPSGTTAHSIETVTPAPAESNSPAGAKSHELQGVTSPQATGTVSSDDIANGSVPGNSVVPPLKEGKTLVAESPVNTPAPEKEETDNNSPVQRGIIVNEERNQLLAEQLPVIAIHPEKDIAESAMSLPVYATASAIKNDQQKQAIRPEEPRDKRCKNSKFALSAFATPLIGGLFTNGHPSSGQSVEQKTSYNIGGQPVSYATGNERPLPSLAAGVKAAFTVSPGWSVSAGLSYTSLKMNKSVFTLVAEREPNNISSTAALGNERYETRRKIAEDKYKVSYNYISVPVQVAYSFKHNKWGVDLTAGTSFNLLSGVTDDPKENYSGNSVAISSLKTPFDYRDVTVGLNAGTYVNYNINNCTGIYAGPQVSTGVQSVYRPYAEKPATIPVTVGIEAGIKIYF